MRTCERYDDLPLTLRWLVEARVSDMENPDAECGFLFEGAWICDPFWDESGRFEVDPVTYYGEAFLNSPFTSLERSNQ